MTLGLSAFAGGGEPSPVPTVECCHMLTGSISHPSDRTESTQTTPISAPTHLSAFQLGLGTCLIWEGHFAREEPEFPLRTPP